MGMGYADPLETLFAFQRALENRFSNNWLGASTASMGTYPPVNVFQQDDNLVAIIELPGVDKTDLNIQAKENTIRVALASCRSMAVTALFQDWCRLA